MLQQTQVKRVLPKYNQFLSQFPTMQALAKAPVSQVIRAWAPLGYNKRAVRLHQLSRLVLKCNAGILPSEPLLLRHLPGIGVYTSEAIACFAFRKQIPVIDTNIRRVLNRFFYGLHTVSEGTIRATANTVLPPGNAFEWNQSLMDLGATVCISQKPHCSVCPIRQHCTAAPLLQFDTKQTPLHHRAAINPKVSFKGSNRYYRGRVIALLSNLQSTATIDLPTLGESLNPDYSHEDLPWLTKIIEQLSQDGLVHVTQPPTKKAPITISLPH